MASIILFGAIGNRLGKSQENRYHTLRHGLKKEPKKMVAVDATGYHLQLYAGDSDPTVANYGAKPH